LSLVGAGRTIRQISAAMDSPVRLAIFRSDGSFYCVETRKRTTYRVWRERLGPKLWQLLVVADDPSFLTCNSDEALWQALCSDQYTTPILRAWIPWIREQLVGCCRMTELPGKNCSTAVLHAESSDLDRIVSVGLNLNKISIGDEL